MNGHFAEVCNRINHGRGGGDTFFYYCADKIGEEKRIRPNNARQLVEKVEILWQGNPLSCVKSFGSLTCRLCTKERLYIHKAMRKEEEEGTCRLINSCNEYYGACRHIPRFHRYQRYDQSTDEG